MAKTIPLVECWKFVGSTPKKYEGRKRYVSTGALEKDHINEADVENVTYEERPSRANLEAVAGDILFAKMASTEKTFVVDDVSAENIYSTGFCAVRADETKILPKCLYYFLSSPLFLEQKDKNSSGATQKAITNAGLAKITIKLPTLADQRMFVMQMDLLTDLISARKEQLEKLDQLVKSRFVELFGDPVKNNMGWESKPLNDVCDGIGDGLHGTPEYDEGGEYPFINGNNLIDGEIIITPATKMVAAKTYEKHFVDISTNAILISINGTLGKLAFYNGEKVMLGKSACYCNLKQDINKVFVYGVMKSDAFAEFLENSSTKSTIKNVGLKAMREFRLILPPMELQEQFAAFVEQTDKSKLAIQQSLDKLELLKKSLMQEYFG